MAVAEQEKQFSGNPLPRMSDVIMMIQRLTVTVMGEVENWPRQEQRKNQDPIAGVNFTVVPNRVTHSVISSSGWTTLALVEADLLKVAEKDSVEEDQEWIEMPEGEGEEEDVGVGSPVNHHPAIQGERGNVEIVAKKVQLSRLPFIFLILSYLSQI
jgi:hypothetical protein